MQTRAQRGVHWFAWFTVAATFLLIVIGASVTSNRAGLSVPDWPTTWGQNMFLYPLNRMIGGIFYEHSHRLMASFVGLLSIGLAVWLVAVEKRRWVRWLGIAALGAVITQGILGGLTVLTYLPAQISIAHAALAQGFFCMVVTLALVTSSRWHHDGSEPCRLRVLPWFALATTVLVYAQLILGATLRHANKAVFLHIVGGIVVLLAAGITGFALFSSVRRRDLTVLAVTLTALVLGQIWLGVAALTVRAPKDAIGQITQMQVWLPTAHLALGALILAVSLVITLKTFRHLQFAPDGGRRSSVRDYVDLAKPRIVTMVMVTTALGFVVGATGAANMWLLILTVAGVGLATAGSAVLNNYLERDTDALMERTRHRALPAGLIAPEHALAAGVSLVLAGLFVLVSFVNLLTAFLVLLAAFLYVLVYTPMKKMTWLNTTFGAIPGAIPPLCGWAAASGRLGFGGWVLFGILFAWQHPHFFAIAWMFREDYARAGFKMLPVIEPDGRSTARQATWYSVLLLGLSAVPVALGMAGRVYLAGALLIGLLMLASSLLFARHKTWLDARRLLKASVVYLPLLLVLILLDAGW